MTPPSEASPRGAVPAPTTHPGERPDLSLVFPVYDEAENIDALLDAATQTAEKIVADFEVVVVDDGSRDASAGIVSQRRQGDPRIRLVRHGANRGYGAALRSGLRAARGELVFFSDADCQFDLAEISLLLPLISEADIVAGYRHPRRDPWPRRVIAGCWGILVRQLFDLRVRDINCAFKLFRRQVLEAIQISANGAFVNTEILLRAHHAGQRLRQVPVSHRPRQFGRQSGASPRVLLRAIAELLQLYGELRRPSPDSRNR